MLFKYKLGTVLRCSSLLLSLCLFAPAMADQNDDVLGDGTGEQFGHVIKRNWQEGQFAIPESPVGDRLLKLKIFEMPDYHYYIDRQSIDVAAGDNVARYTVVVEPPSGLRNVFFEGIRCDKRQYKTYATALWGEALKAVTASDWQDIPNRGVGVYRSDLYRYFLCENSIIKGDKKQIIQLLEYPPYNFIEEELE